MNHALLISRRALLAVAATLAAGSISGCVPLIVGAPMLTGRRPASEAAGTMEIPCVSSSRRTTHAEALPSSVMYVRPTHAPARVLT